MSPTSSISDLPNSAAANPKLGGYMPVRQSAFGQKGFDLPDLAFGEDVSPSAGICHRWAGDMLPRLTGNDVGNGFHANPEASGNLVAVLALADKIKNLRNLAFGQFRGRCQRSGVSIVQPGIVSVLNVLGLRDPLQILYSVVQLVSVDVVSLVRGAWGWTNKRFQNQPMNHHRSLFVPDLHRGHGVVSAFVKHGPQDSVYGASGAFGVSLNSPKAACRVIAHPVRNWFPYLFHGKSITSWCSNYNTSTVNIGA